MRRDDEGIYPPKGILKQMICHSIRKTAPNYASVSSKATGIRAAAREIEKRGDEGDEFVLNQSGRRTTNYRATWLQYCIPFLTYHRLMPGEQLLAGADGGRCVLRMRLCRSLRCPPTPSSNLAKTGAETVFYHTAYQMTVPNSAPSEAQSSCKCCQL